MSGQDELPWTSPYVKTYRGFPGPPEAKVTVDDPGGPRFLEPGNSEVGFDWGKKARPAAAVQLAIALATDVTGDAMIAARIYQRLKHRTVLLWADGQPWSITHKELSDHVADILKIERDTAGERAAVARQPAPVVNEGGGGVRRSDHDAGPQATLDVSDEAIQKARASAIAKLTPDERRALGL